MVPPAVNVLVPFVLLTVRLASQPAGVAKVAVLLARLLSPSAETVMVTVLVRGPGQAVAFTAMVAVTVTILLAAASG